MENNFPNTAVPDDFITKHKAVCFSPRDGVVTRAFLCNQFGPGANPPGVPIPEFGVIYLFIYLCVQLQSLSHAKPNVSKAQKANLYLIVNCSVIYYNRKKLV